MASVRLVAPSFTRSAATWNLTVWIEMPSRRAITLFGAPSASSASTSASRGERCTRRLTPVSSEPFYVAAEEAVEPDEELQLSLASGETATTKLVGRDPSTGIALFKLATAAVDFFFDNLPD